MLAAGCLCVLAPVFCRAGAAGDQATPASSPGGTNLTARPTIAENGAGAGSNSPTVLPTVTVTADLDRERDQIAPDLGAVTYTIGQNQIQTMAQGENSSFQQVLLHAPGVVQDEFGEVHIRGDHGDAQYRVNGVLLPESLNGFGQEIDPHIVRSVTLITGTLPAQFGERTAGIVDVTTKSGYQLNGSSVSLYGGSYDTINPTAVFGGSTSNWDYFVSASYLHNNLGIDNTTSSADPLHDITDQEKLFGYFSHRFDETSRLTLLLSGSYADFEIPDTAGLSPNYMNSANSTPADSAIVNEHQNEQNYYAVVSYQKSADKFSTQVSAFSRYAGIHFFPDTVQELLLDGNAAEIKNNDWADGLQADAEYELNDRHTLRAGGLATYDIEHLDSAGEVFPARTQFAPSPSGQGLPGPAPQSSTTPAFVAANSRNTGLTSAFYLQDEWHLVDSLTLNYGLRYDRFDASFDHENQISPRVNLVWQINKTTTAHAGYARYFIPPTLQYIPPSFIRAFENTTDAPFSERDDPQKVERDHYFDAGVSRQITKDWQVNLDSFCKLAKNLLDDGQFGTAVILNNFNYSDGTVYGAELSSTYKHGPFSAYGNVSFVQTDAKNINSSQYEFPDNELNYVAANSIQLDHQGRFTGSGGVSYTIMKNTTLHTDFLYGNGLRAGFANLDKLPSYWTMNVGVEYVWRLHRASLSALKFRFDCLNLFDQVYEIRDGTGIGIAAPAYGSRRAFYAGITAVF
jgi:outer membrane receptor protein involved in Fe transport